MTAAAKKIATYEDILALPPHVTGQIIFGSLYTNPRPAIPHALAASALGEELGGPFKRGRGGPGDGSFLMSPNCIWTQTSWFRIWPAGVAHVYRKPLARRF